MALLSARDRRTAEAIAGIGYCNPFLPERVQSERKAMGADFVEYRLHLRTGVPPEELFPNLQGLGERADALAKRMRTRLCAGEPVSQSDLILYEDLALYLLYKRHMSNFVEIITAAEAARVMRMPFWRDFRDEFQYFFHVPDRTLPSQYDPAFVFAGLFQIERAFIHIFDCIVGGSTAAARLRADVWQSVFTHDMRRYVRVVHQHMGDIATLVTGPSGSGKELVARAIGRSRFIEFDPKSERFVADHVDSFRPVNLSALAPTLIESELFGHRRGAYTGATEDREGRLEACGPYDSIFLDEIGDLSPSIQVKLLRVLESREFERVGESEPTRRFQGKLLAATNRDLGEEMQQGRFREDLYYRLCADIVTTPSLREQLCETPDDLPNLVRFVAGTILPNCAEEAECLASEALAWIERNLGLDYPWRGNMRELGQCVRNILIRKTYRPPGPARDEACADSRRAFVEKAATGVFTSDELVRHYFTLVYAETGSYEAAAERLQVDWRTVRKRVDPDLLQTYRNG